VCLRLTASSPPVFEYAAVATVFLSGGGGGGAQTCDTEASVVLGLPCEPPACRAFCTVVDGVDEGLSERPPCLRPKPGLGRHA